MAQEPQRNENATVAQTVAEKFTNLPGNDKAFVLGYLLGKEDERTNEDNFETEKGADEGAAND